MAETLNAVFDIFPEPDFDAQLAAHKFVDLLANFVPHVQQLLHTQMQSAEQSGDEDDAALSERLDETLQNLQAFVDYKRN